MGRRIGIETRATAPVNELQADSVERAREPCRMDTAPQPHDVFCRLLAWPKAQSARWRSRASGSQVPPPTWLSFKLPRSQGLIFIKGCLLPFRLASAWLIQHSGVAFTGPRSTSPLRPVLQRLGLCGRDSLSCANELEASDSLG